MLPTQKFSGFADGGDAQVGDTIVGLRGGINTRFTYPNGLPVGTILPISQGGTGANNATDARINLGLGTIAVQDASSVAITGGSAAFGSASVNDAPVANIDIANKLYVDSQISGNLANYVTLATAQNITGAKTFQADVDMDSNFITNLSDPVNPQDAATRAFVLANGEGLINVEYFTSSGTYNKTAGANFAIVVAIGGGGGGGYGAPASSQAMVGSGGGSGGYGELYLDLTAITSETVTIGANGTGGVGSTTTNATNGGTTSFGALLTALGGGAGEQSNSGAGNYMIRGGLGAVPGAGGNLNIDGSPGFSAQRISASIYMGGHGGGGFFGGSGRSIATSSGQNNSGGSGQSFGAGGGGANSSNGSNVNGGNGADGLVVVYEFA